MKKRIDFEPLLQCIVVELMRIYVNEKLISNPAIFGLKDFSQEELVRRSFYSVGSDDFLLYEKTYRVATSRVYVNFKVYFVNGQLSSNAVEISGMRIKKAMDSLSLLLENPDVINARLFVADSFYFGSLMFNDKINIAFGRSGRGIRRRKFELTGISTDCGFTTDWECKGLSTYSVKLMSDEVDLANIPGKYKNCKEILGLAKCIMKNFRVVNTLKCILG